LKSIINHRFVKEMMRNDESRVRAVYGAFETTFHLDGLYWLQYGPPYAGWGVIQRRWRNSLPREGFSSPQIEHAYAQQTDDNCDKAATWDEAEPQLLEAIRSLRSLNNVGRKATLIR